MDERQVRARRLRSQALLVPDEGCPTGTQARIPTPSRKDKNRGITHQLSKEKIVNILQNAQIAHLSLIPFLDSLLLSHSDLSSNVTSHFPVWTVFPLHGLTAPLLHILYQCVYCLPLRLGYELREGNRKQNLLGKRNRLPAGLGGVGHLLSSKDGP